MSDTIKVKVLFFGATADASGSRSIDFEAPAGADSRSVFDLVVGEYPSLARHRLLFSVNQEYVRDETPISDGDELAIFTAVSGG